MRIIRKKPEAPAPEPPPAKADPVEAVAATLERVQKQTAQAMGDITMVNQAVAEALAARQPDEKKPTRYEVKITGRDQQGRLTSFVIEAK